MKMSIVWGAGGAAILLVIGACQVYCPEPVGRGVLWGGLLSSFINILSFITVRYTFAKSIKKLLASVIGGISVRMVVLALSAYYLRNNQSILVVWYLMSFLGCFMIYQVLEIYYFYTKIDFSSKQKSSGSAK